MRTRNPPEATASVWLSRNQARPVLVCLLFALFGLMRGGAARQAGESTPYAPRISASASRNRRTAPLTEGPASPVCSATSFRGSPSTSTSLAASREAPRERRSFARASNSIGVILKIPSELRRFHSSKDLTGARLSTFALAPAAGRHPRKRTIKSFLVSRCATIAVF
jgi:hypothetical protein